jgi:hypothetical protein
VLDALGGRIVDLGAPEELCLPAEKDPPRPVAETLEPCDAVDVWRFDARAGRTVEVTLDTAGDADAADLCTDVVCGGLELAGDDEVACTTPSFRCPRVRGVATTDSPCVATVRACAGGCVEASMARYVIRAGVAGEDAVPALLVDDARGAP